MKKLLWMILFFLLVSCQQAQTPPMSPTGMITATRYRVSDTPAAPAITPTRTRRPKPTPWLTVTATPTVTLVQLNLPAVREKMPAYKLALNEFNTGTEMKRLNIYGTGELNDLAFSPDGKFLAAATGR